MTDRPVDARIERGIELMTAHLSRPPDAGLDEELFRTILGPHVTDDDLIEALHDMVTVSELIMMTYQVKTDIRPIEVLREVATYRQSDRRGEAGGK